MFFFSKHKANHKKVNHNLAQDMLAQSWVNRCLRLQHKASLFFQGRSEKLSLSSKRLIVIAFCLISFSSCVYLVIKSLLNNNPANLSIAPIRIPKQVAQSDSRQITVPNGVSKDEFQKIKKFRAYVDSLGSSNSGRRVYDSILRYRPGLIDSLAIVENLYKSQSLNK